MSTSTASDEHLERAIGRLLAQHERFSPSINPDASDPAGVVAMDCAQLGQQACVDAAIAQCRSIFSLDKPKHTAQLWLYTLLGDLAAPSVHLMVEEDVVPDLDLRSGELFRRDGDFWFGFRPLRQAGSVEASARGLGLSLAGLVAGLCSHLDLRPAPLWSVIADGLIQPAVGAGNQAFETARAFEVAQQLREGLLQGANEGAAVMSNGEAASAAGAGDGDAARQQVTLPPLRVDAVEDGQIIQADLQELLASGEEPEYLLAHRSSCCMIYHSPNAGVCTSCPHQDREQRIAGQLAALQPW
ncbi:(2Fe-2S)-binding protein [Corynebacterium pseudopelargi]|uniref:Ferric siderophore reductase C-terminal domain-containing protein n=1 Tax=Corynebacterium pseudopelargi TaxID=2080757 RepID=A0A3G6IXZ8_9CORY|nr:(2Fe-2S)-binding protein [Corynebacterium pseudopelargi]AZA09528.1 hypothetical protein CPPEL_07090 [Corynebacterium pseudopelargi]